MNRTRVTRPTALWCAALLLGACGTTTPAGSPRDGAAPPSDVAAHDTAARDDAAPQLDAAPDDAAASDGAAPPPDASDAGVADGWQFPPRAVCPGSYGSPTASSNIDDNELREASGLAASPKSPDVVWTHNDSGGGSRLFAVSVAGKALGRLTLEGAPSGDWEDLAAGACPDGAGPCLWVEDRGSHKVYAIVEPVVSTATPFGEASTTDYWTFQTIYPGGIGPDVEALLVEPDGAAFYLIEKVQGDRARIFGGVTPLERVADVTLTEVGSVASPGALGVARDITGGDLHPSRTRLVLRTYLAVYEYRLQPGDFPGNLDAAERIEIPVPLTLEPSGEAVTYDQAGDGILTLSEGLLTLPGQPLHHFPCQ